MKKISPQDLKARLDRGEPMQLIDVRSPGEYASGHVPGALNLPLEEVEARLDDVARHDPVVLVCQSGSRACLSHDVLQHHRSDLIVLEGGTSAWEAASLAVVSGGNPRWSIERQVRLAAGLLVLVGAVLGFSLSPGWFGLSAFVGAGLTFAGLTNICGMAFLFGKLPWNRPTRPSAPRVGSTEANA